MATDQSANPPEHAESVRACFVKSFFLWFPTLLAFLSPCVPQFWKNISHKIGKKISLECKIFYKKPLHIFLFLMVNVVIGSLGVWMTLFTSPMGLTYGSFNAGLIQILASCGPYTFAIAYLAAATSYVAYEYFEEDQTVKVKRKAKTFLSAIAFGLIIFCTLLSGFQTQKITSDSLLSSQAHNSITAQTRELSTSSQPTYDPSSGVLTFKSEVRLNEINELLTDKIPLKNKGKNRALNTSEWLQIWLVISSIVVGLILYIVSKWGDTDMKVILEAYIDDENKASQNLGNPKPPDIPPSPPLRT